MNDILAILSGGDYVSGEKISQELGISRAAVWKRIAQLREEGWQIEAAGRRGYRLIPGDSLDPIFWVNQLTTKTLGRAINHYEHTITSSNTLVKQMAVQGGFMFDHGGGVEAGPARRDCGDVDGMRQVHAGLRRGAAHQWGPDVEAGDVEDGLVGVAGDVGASVAAAGLLGTRLVDGGLLVEPGVVGAVVGSVAPVGRGARPRGLCTRGRRHRPDAGRQRGVVLLGEGEGVGHVAGPAEDGGHDQPGRDVAARAHLSAPAKKSGVESRTSAHQPRTNPVVSIG